MDSEEHPQITLQSIEELEQKEAKRQEKRIQQELKNTQQHPKRNHSVIKGLFVSLTLWGAAYLGSTCLMFLCAFTLPFYPLLYRHLENLWGVLWFSLSVLELKYVADIEFRFFGDQEILEKLAKIGQNDSLIFRFWDSLKNKNTTKNEEREINKELDLDCFIMISNHRTRLDWMFLWTFFFYFSDLNRIKIVLKHVLKLLPGFGWAMQFFRFVFLRRNWNDDYLNLKRILTAFVEEGLCIGLLIFPEGTDMCPNALRRYAKFLSDQRRSLLDTPSQNTSSGETATAPVTSETNASTIQKKAILLEERFNYVIHPRVRGLNACVQFLSPMLDSIYDVTVAYPDHIPQYEKDLVLGNFPNEVHFHFHRVPIEEIPINDEEALTKWCLDRWRIKDRLLQSYYENDCDFRKTDIIDGPPMGEKRNQRVTEVSLSTLAQNDLRAVAGVLAFGSLFLIAPWIFTDIRLFTLFCISNLFFIIITIKGGIEDYELQFLKKVGYLKLPNL